MTKKKIFIIYAIFLASIILSSIIYGQWQTLDQRYSFCNELLLNNEIYEGQPYCEQPPVIYLISSPIEGLFGNAGIVISSIIFNLVILGLLYNLLRKMDLISTILLTILYCTLVYPILLLDYAALLAVLFLTPGLYYLLNKNNLYLSSLFFTLSFLSKATTLVIAVFAIGLWIYKNRKYRDIWKIYPGLLLILFMIIIYPKFIIYGFLAHSGTHLDLLSWDGLIIGIKANLGYLFIYGLILISSVSLFKKEKFLSIIAFSSFIIILLTISKAAGFGNGLDPYYLSTTLILFVITGINYFNEVKLNKSVVLLLSVSSIILFSVQAYDNHGYNDIREKYTEAYEILQDFGGSILIDADIQEQAKLKNNGITVFPAPLPIDSSYTDVLLKWGMMNETAYEEEYVSELESNYEDILTKLRNKEYDLVIFNSALIRNDSKDAFNNYLNLYFRRITKDEDLDRLLIMPSPNKIDCLKCFGAFSFFTSKEERNIHLIKLGIYFGENFDFFCERDEEFTNTKILTNLVIHNGIKPNKKCESSAGRYIRHTNRVKRL